MELTFLLEECSDAFRRTDEYERLKEHRPKERSLLVDERTAINVCVQQTFLSVYKIMKAEDGSFDEEDLVVCALGAMRLKTAVIADCLSVSAEAVRMRKRRIRRKIGDERYEVVFGPIDRVTAKVVNMDGEEVPAEVEVLPVVEVQRTEGVKVKMRFGEAVSSCFRKAFTYDGRARRAEYWYYYLFMNMVWLGYKATKGLVIYCFLPLASPIVQNCASCANDIISWTATVALMIPMLAVTARRLHDLGDTGWISVGIYLLPWLLGVGFSVYTDNFKDVALDEIDESLNGLIGMLGSYLVFYMFEFAALMARVIMMARRGMVGENEYGADPIRYIQ